MAAINDRYPRMIRAHPGHCRQDQGS